MFKNVSCFRSLELFSKKYFYPDWFAILKFHSTCHLAQFLQYLFHTWAEAEHHKLQENSLSPPFYWFHRCCKVHLPTEALINAWSRKKLLLACKPWDKSIQQKGGNVKRLKKSNGSETLVHVGLVPKGIWKPFITAACEWSAEEERGWQPNWSEGRKKDISYSSKALLVLTHFHRVFHFLCISTLW